MKKLIFSLSLLILIGFILKADMTAAAPIIQGDNGNKFAGFDDTGPDVLGTSTTPYQDVNSDVHISGNVGIGTIVPNAKLNIYQGDISLNLADSGSQGILGYEGTDTNPHLGIDFNYLGTGDYNNIQISNWSGGSASPLVTFQRGGYVGIGTNTPADKIQVGNLTDGGNFVQSAPSGWRDAYRIYRAGTQVASLGMDTTGNKLQFFTGSSTGNSTARLTIDSAGNVGIGTNIPSYPLDVNGVAKMTGFRLGSAATPGNVLTATAAGDGTGTWQAPPAGGGSTPWSSLTNPTANLTLGMAGYSTVFSWAPTGNQVDMLTLTDQVNNQAWGIMLNVYTKTGSLENPFRVAAAGKEAIYVNQSGQVGISTTNFPSGTLVNLGTNYIHVRSTGEVGIGTADTSAYGYSFYVGKPANGGAGPGFQMDTWGNIRKIYGISYSWPTAQGGVGSVLTNNGSGTLTWSGASDIRLKDDISNFDDGLTTIRQLNPVSYEYNGKGGTTNGSRGIGIIAQDVKDIIPYAISTFKAKLNPEDQQETELYSFNQNPLTFIELNAIKELDQKNTSQDTKIKKLEEEVELLKQEIEQLKK